MHIKSHLGEGFGCGAGHFSTGRPDKSFPQQKVWIFLGKSAAVDNLLVHLIWKWVKWHLLVETSALNPSGMYRHGKHLGLTFANIFNWYVVCLVLATLLIGIPICLLSYFNNSLRKLDSLRSVCCLSLNFRIDQHFSHFPTTTIQYGSDRTCRTCRCG